MHLNDSDRTFAVKNGGTDMINNLKQTEAGQEYAAAYDAHYTTKDMHKAFVLYQSIIKAHPDTLEAGYSRSQVQNIVNAVVPKQKVMKVMDALAKVAFTHLEKGVPPEAETV